MFVCESDKELKTWMQRSCCYSICSFSRDQSRRQENEGRKERRELNSNFEINITDVV